MWILPTVCSLSETDGSSVGHRSCQLTYSSVGSFPWPTAPYQEPTPALKCCRLLQAHLPALVWNLTQPAPWPSTGCKGTAWLTVGFTTGWREISAPVRGAHPAPSLSLSSLTLALAEMFLTPLPHSGCTAFLTFLNTLSQRHHHCHWLTQLWTAQGQSWSWLKLASSDTGASTWSFHAEATPAAPPCYIKLCVINPTWTCIH